MPAPISVVIPTLNAAQELPLALAALAEGLEAGLIRELVVTDGGSADATQSVADAAGARWVAGDRGRGGQLRRGCAEAAGDWLLILHADTQLDRGWSAAVANAITAPARAYVFLLAFRAKGFAPSCVAGWANLRTRFLGLPYGDQGLLIPRTTYEKVGGYPDIPLMEDVALVRALQPRPALLPVHAFTSAARYQDEGWFRRGAKNLWTLLRYITGTPPDELAQRYARAASSSSRNCKR